MKRVWGWFYVVAAVSWVGTMINYGVSGELSEFSKWVAMSCCVLFFAGAALDALTEE